MVICIDTEHLTHNGQAQLISLGAVREDGQTFYAISKEFEREKATPWIVEHVLSRLEEETSGLWGTRDGMRTRFVDFVGEGDVQFWSYVAAIDWSLVASLFDRGLDDIPYKWPYACFDLKQWQYHLGSPDIPEHPTDAHHALADAKWHMEVYKHLSDVSAGRGDT
jgi:hypothetical protein